MHSYGHILVHRWPPAGAHEGLQTIAMARFISPWQDSHREFRGLVAEPANTSPLVPLDDYNNILRLHLPPTIVFNLQQGYLSWRVRFAISRNIRVAHRSGLTLPSKIFSPSTTIACVVPVFRILDS